MSTENPILEFETYRKLGSFEEGNLTHKEPSCFNSRVSIRRYKVTVQEIVEPKAVLIARLEKLWRASDNHHHMGPLLEEAKKLGMTLDHNKFGKERKSR